MNNSNGKPTAGNPFTSYKIPLGVRLFISSSRILFRILGSASPQLTGKLALRYFMTPPNFPTPRREEAMRERSELSFQKINGYKIAVRSWGEGPVVLLSHGWGGRGTHFFALIDALVNAGYRAVAFDAPAHGDSSGKRTNMLEVCKTLAAIAQPLSPLKAIVGHSFGCGTALLAMDRLGVSAEKVVLFSCFDDIIWVTEQFGEAFAMNDKVIAAMRHEARSRYGDAFDPPWDWPQLSPLNTIRQVKVDLLLLHDEQDMEVPYPHALKLIEAAPKARLITTTRLGHKKILMDKKSIESCIDFIGA